MAFEAKIHALRSLRRKISAARTRLMGNTDDPMRPDQRTAEVRDFVAFSALCKQELDRWESDIASLIGQAVGAHHRLPPGPGGRGPGPGRNRLESSLQKARRLEVELAAVAAELAAFDSELWAGPSEGKKLLDALAKALEGMAEAGQIGPGQEQQLVAVVQQVSGTLMVKQPTPIAGVDLLTLLFALVALLRSRGR